MKSYNIKNYIRYKEDLKQSIKRLDDKPWEEYTRDELIIKFLPLVENLGRKFPTSQQASGVLSINDIIQIGAEALTRAVDRLNWEMLEASEDIEILRFIEMNIPVRMLELEGSPIHVDTPEDLERAQIIAKDYN